MGRIGHSVIVIEAMRESVTIHGGDDATKSFSVAPT